MGNLSRRHFMGAAGGLAATAFLPEDAYAMSGHDMLHQVIDPLAAQERARMALIGENTATVNATDIDPQIGNPEAEGLTRNLNSNPVPRLLTEPKIVPDGAVSVRDNTYAAAAAIVFLDRPGQPEVYFGNPDRSYIPASLTKMVTLAVAFDELQRDRLSLTENLPAFTRAERSRLRSTHRNFPNTCNVHEGLLVTGVCSNNATAAAIGRRISGSRRNPGTETAFTNRMNIKAVGDMGMRNSSFYCASGYDDRSETTLRDQISLLKYFNSDPERCAFFRTYFGANGATVAGRFYSSTATVLATRSQNIGLKTGFTTRAQSNISLITEENGERIGITILRAPSARDRNNQVLELLRDVGYGEEPVPTGPVLYTDLVPSA